MAIKGNIFCSIERLTDREQGDDGKSSGRAVAGITLSASWEDQSDSPANFLLPWNWLSTDTGPEQLSFRVWAIRYAKNGKPSSVPPLRVKPRALKKGDRDIAQIRRDTKCYSGLTDTLTARLSGLPKGYTPKHTLNASTGAAASYAGNTPWPTVLTDLATRPAPVPQVLLLSFILEDVVIADILPKGAKPEEWRLFAAPVIPRSVIGDQETDLTSTAALQDNLVTVFWNYKADGYQAQCESVSLADTVPAHSFFDMNTRMVKAANSQAWHFDEDWQTSLEARLGDALDFGAELLHQIELLPAGADARPYADAAIAALRDVAGIGIDPGPSGQPLMGVDKAAHDKIVAASIPVFGTAILWKAFLLSQISDSGSPLYDSNLARAAIWTSGTLPRESALLQIQALRQKLLAPDALKALTQKQIDKLSLGGSIDLSSALAKIAPGALPQALRAENLGRYWTDLRLRLKKQNGIDYTPDSLRAGLIAGLQAAARARFAKNRTADGLPLYDAGDTIRKQLDTTASWKAFANRAIPANPGDNVAQNPGTGMAAQGITVQVTEFDDPNAVSPGEVNLVHKLQGVSLLLERASGSPGWNCLNYADIYYMRDYMEDGKKKVRLEELEKNVVVANRFTYQNSAALATITYNNEPLPAAGPLSVAAAAVDPPANSSQGGPEVSSDLLIYRYSPAPLTPLVHGRDYLPQPFLIGASGTMPKMVARDADHPFDLAADLSTVSKLGDTWTKISYRRLSGVGQLRLSNVIKDATDLKSRRTFSFPAIPDGVFPLTPYDPMGKSARPLLLLVPPDSDDTGVFTGLPTSFDFAVRPPATDILTWDRFVNRADTALSGLRATVMTEILKAVQANLKSAKLYSPVQNRANNESLADITIDDPATVMFKAEGEADYDTRFRIELLDENGKPVLFADGKSLYQIVKFPSPVSSAPGLGPVQAGSATVRVRSALSGPLSITASASTVEVIVPAATRATLRLSVCVPDAYAERFRGVDFGQADSGYFFINPIDMGLEVATTKLPDVQKIFAGFSIAEPFSVLNGTARVELDFSAVPDREFVHSAEVLRQIWAWQGCPMDPILPDEKGKKDWLLQQFGTRADSDFLRCTMTPGDHKFTWVEDLSSLVTPQQRAEAKLPSGGSAKAPTDAALRGTYIRYGIQVESRYKPLIKLPGKTRVTPGFVRGVDDGRIWKDLYVPSRKSSGLKPPDVKLALPLTRNSDDPDAGPGILLLIRGPWFQDCGLGETLEARIAMVQDPSQGPDATTRTFYFQYGPDPLLQSAQNVKLISRDKWDNSTAEGFGTITGPVGHTFDTVSSGQLFLNTSFVLNYPTIDGISSSSWSFCQIQVRRAVFTLDEDGRKYHRTGASDWTQPMWVQLLPDFDLYSDKSSWNKYANLLLQPGSLNSFNLTDQAGNTVPAPQAGTGDSMFSEFLAVTHFVADATGVPTQETFDSVCLWKDGSWQPLGSVGLQAQFDTIVKEAAYRGRLITVQGRPGAPAITTEDSFWNALFDPAKPDRERLRITGVSRPIDMKNSKYFGC
jgi:hypothetical protein